MLKDGNFVRPSTGEKPDRVCFIQCVGSRDRQIGNQWCSKVCCGIACKQAIEVREFLPDARVFVSISPAHVWILEDEIYWKAQEEKNVNFIRGIVTEVTKRGDTLVVKGEDTTMGRPMEVAMDVIFFRWEWSLAKEQPKWPALLIFPWNLTVLLKPLWCTEHR
jgi:heterodisulfide reductase subunit A